MSRARVFGLAALLTIPFGVASGRAATPTPIVFAANLAPAVTGEIYRLDPNGRRADLSKSAWQDTDPVVSTDGKHVAFLSNRSGRTGVYEVGINGGNLVRVAPSLSRGYPLNLAWQPHGSVLAAESSGAAVPEGRVLLLRPHRKPLVVSHRFGFGTVGMIGTPQPWSPDGRILLVWAAAAGMRAVSPQGRTLWTAYADQPIAAWSAHGLLAVPVYHGVAIYDEHGHRRARFRLSQSNPTFAWSPDGRHLAVFYSTPRGNYQLDVRTAAGKLVLHQEHLPGYEVVWAGNSEIVLGLAGCALSACGEPVGIAIRTGKESHASAGWLDPLSADRKLAVVTAANGPGFSVGVASPGGGATSVYAQVGGCSGESGWTPAVSALQFAGPTRSLVYQSWSDCDGPLSNLYSMAPDGTFLRRLTSVEAEQSQPAISPDGHEVAYVWAQAIGKSCEGCSDGIRIATTDGAAVQTLTNPPDCTFDDSPTWSPDGKTILFSRATCDGSLPELFTIDASGGAVHDLGVAGTEPALGPSQIAYVTAGSGHGIWTANPDGSGRSKVSTKGDRPSWSSDGRLAYLVGSAKTTVVLGSKHVTLPFAQIASLAWSPNGTRFLVVARKKSDPAFDVYTVKTNGADPTRLTWNYGVTGASW
jgi:Tol biopolymer transport system component